MWREQEYVPACNRKLQLDKMIFKIKKASKENSLEALNLLQLYKLLNNSSNTTRMYFRYHALSGIIKHLGFF
jgi:hypothetical protein